MATLSPRGDGRHTSGQTPPPAGAQTPPMHELQEVAGAFDGLLQARAELVKEKKIPDSDRSRSWNVHLAESVKVTPGRPINPSLPSLLLGSKSRRDVTPQKSQTPVNLRLRRALQTPAPLRHCQEVIKQTQENWSPSDSPSQQRWANREETIESNESYEKPSMFTGCTVPGSFWTVQ